MRRYLGVLGILAACTGAPSAEPEPTPNLAQTAPVSGDSLMVTLSIDPGNANPLVAPYQVSGWIIDLVNPGLVRRAIGPDGVMFEPALAKDWSFSDDGLSLTYNLRSDIVFEDGTPLTADDVVFTYELIADPRVASNWQGDAKNIASVTANGPHSVTFAFNAPQNPLLLQGLTIRGIIAKHVFESVPRNGLREHDSGRSPTASGPFRVASWVPMQRVILEPNPKAPSDWTPKLDRIVFRVQSEPSTRKLATLKGEVDLDPAVEPGQVAEYKGRDDLELVYQRYDSMVYLGYNLTKPKWNDKNVRTALALATDTQALIDRVYTHDGEVFAHPCVSTVGPNLGGWSASDITPLPHDPARASALLAESGWADADGDGVLDKDGESLRVRVMYQNGDDATRDLLTLMQRHWAAVGVDLQMEPLDGTTFQSRARSKTYDAVLWGFGNNPLVKPAITWSSTGSYNWFGYSNSRVDALLATGESAPKLEDAQAAVREAQGLIYEDQPVLFLLWLDGVMVRQSRFKDVQHDTFNAVRSAENWWVPTPLQKY
ncbi:MAG: ABC transporter substrate-binding protein [Myxococcota bacterium]